MKRILFSKKGYMTVEAAIIVPTIFISVIALVYICVLMYQQVYIQTVANQAAETGAAIWNSPAKDMFLEKISKENMKKTLPYWHFYDGNESYKKTKLNEYVNYSIENYSTLGRSTKSTVETSVDNKIIYRKLIVTVKHTYKMPTGELLKPFGIGSEYTVTAKAEAVVNEPVEFIRNIDFLTDTGRQIDEATGNHVANINDKVVGILSKFTDKLSSFLD